MVLTLRLRTTGSILMKTALVNPRLNSKRLRDEEAERCILLPLMTCIKQVVPCVRETVTSVGSCYGMKPSGVDERATAILEKAPGQRGGYVGRFVRQFRPVLVFSTSLIYNCNNIYNSLGKRSGIGKVATAEERNESENPDLRYRDGSEEGSGEGLQACHRTLAERALCLFPSWRNPSEGCTRG
jgi:hypothetical protein